MGLGSGSTRSASKRQLRRALLCTPPGDTYHFHRGCKCPLCKQHLNLLESLSHCPPCWMSSHNHCRYSVQVILEVVGERETTVAGSKQHGGGGGRMTLHSKYREGTAQANFKRCLIRNSHFQGEAEKDTSKFYNYWCSKGPHCRALLIAKRLIACQRHWNGANHHRCFCMSGNSEEETHLR